MNDCCSGKFDISCLDYLPEGFLGLSGFTQQEYLVHCSLPHNYAYYFGIVCVQDDSFRVAIIGKAGTLSLALHHVSTVSVVFVFL